MTNIKNSSSVVRATKGSKVLYLSAKDEERGLDIKLDLQGWKLSAL